MKDRFGTSVIKFVLTVAIVLGAAWLVLNRQSAIDQLRLLTYTPTAEVKALADASQMHQRGRDLFYVSNPQVQDREAFNRSCESHERTIVLGCYKAQQIYLYNIKDERFNGIKEVTAAHEMLHAAYERLSEGERQSVDAMLKPIIEGMTDKRILKLIELYNRTEPGQLYNEMHAILGTEYAALTPELETYYQRYFKDRGAVLTFAAQYQAIFAESEKKIEDYDRELGTLKPQIDQNNITLKRLQDELQTESTQLNQYRASGQIEQYNRMVPVYNAKVANFNALIERTRAMVERHNSIVEDRNNQVAAQDNLYNTIDSNYEAASQQ